MSRIVFVTFGSLGDLHPSIALASEWISRGNSAVIATSEVYRQKVLSEGIEFSPVRPDLPNSADQGPLLQQIMDMHRGPEFLFRKVVLPYIRESYTDILAASEGADAIVGHPLTFAVPLVAKKRSIRWAYTALAPITFLSAYDGPLLSYRTTGALMAKLRRALHRLITTFGRRWIDHWFDCVRVLSKEIGTYPCQQSPIGGDQFSPYLNLALFSSVLGGNQPDWPDNTTITGYPYYDQLSTESALDPDLERFLNNGEPPVVFTLGSAAVGSPGSFYRDSIGAVIHLGCRAVLLVGNGDRAEASLGEIPNTIFVAKYAPFSLLFPRCCAAVHQGGIGTTSQALRAGIPMLVVPFAFDQPDNGRRVVRLGVGRTVARRSFSANLCAAELAKLMTGSYKAQAENVSRLIKMENGARAACDVIEQRLLRG